MQIRPGLSNGRTRQKEVVRAGEDQRGDRDRRRTCLSWYGSSGGLKWTQAGKLGGGPGAG